MTHVFNPYTFQPKHDPLDLISTSGWCGDIAWSPDGLLLYKVLPFRDVTRAPSEELPLLRNGSSSSELDNYQSVTVPLACDGKMKNSKLLCALDMSSESPLRCCEDRATGCAGDQVPFCMEWQLQAPCSTGSDAENGDSDTPRVAVNGQHIRFSFVEAESFAEKVRHDRLNNQDSETELLSCHGIRRLPGMFGCGMALFRGGVRHGATLTYDLDAGKMLLCSVDQLQSVCAAET
jgi:hypothetical protein